MVLDATAIEKLELIECDSFGTKTREGSLIQYLDHTKT